MGVNSLIKRHFLRKRFFVNCSIKLLGISYHHKFETLKLINVLGSPCHSDLFSCGSWLLIASAYFSLVWNNFI